MKIPNLKWTLYKKIQLLIGIILIIVFTLIIVVNDSLITHSVESNFYEDARTTSLLLQQNIEAILEDTKNSLLYVKKEFEADTEARVFIEEVIELLVESNSMIMNSFVVYNNGDFILRPYVELPDSFDPRVRSWYKAAYASREVNWSQPYEDVATGTYVMTASVYFELEDMDGALGVDISLERLPEIISATKLSDNGYFILVNSKGTVIASSIAEIQRNMSLEDLEDTEFTTSGLVTGRKTTSKGIYYARQLNNSDLRLIAFLPKEDLEAVAKSAQWSSAFVVLIGMFLGLVFSYFFLKKVTKPLTKLIDVMNESNYEEDIVLYEGNTNDELNTLLVSYNSLATNVNEHKRRLQRMSKELLSSEQKLQEQYIKTVHIAYSDALTGLPNRIKFEEAAKKKIKKGNAFATMYIDLDNFKYINDTYGHNVGDEVLKIVSDRLIKCCKGVHFGARLSGDEFGVLVDYEEELESIENIANKILEFIHQPIVTKDVEFIITGSIGISLYPENGLTFEELLANADIAMYEAKNKGKGKHKVYKEIFKKDLIYRVKLETRLQHSIDKNELVVNYQPIYEFESKKIKGFEALVRWIDSEMGMIYPDIFIPIAEHNLFITKIGRFVLEETLKFANELYEKQGIHYIMNVNVSVIQLHNIGFVKEVEELLEKYKYSVEYLNLEITESISLENTEVLSRLDYLRNLGVRLSLDDFGTGYSSFNHLIQLPLTELKIDRDVIITATENKVVHHLVQSIVDFAHAKNLTVVAEGIEDKRMESLMFDLGVDYVQGYLYSRPLSKEAVLDYLEI